MILLEEQASIITAGIVKTLDTRTLSPQTIETLATRLVSPVTVET